MSAFPFAFSARRMEIIVYSAAIAYDLPASALAGRQSIGSPAREAQTVALAAARELLDAPLETLGQCLGVTRWRAASAERFFSRNPEHAAAAKVRLIVKTLTASAA